MKGNKEKDFQNHIIRMARKTAAIEGLCPESGNEREARVINLIA